MFLEAGPWGIAGFLLFLPIALTWRLQRLALAHRADDPRLVRYAYRLAVGRVVLGTWLLWLTFRFLFPTMEISPESLGVFLPADGARLLSLALPALVLAGCQAWPLTVPGAESTHRPRRARMLLAAFAKQGAYAWIFSSFATAQHWPTDDAMGTWLESPLNRLLLMWIGIISVHYCLGFLFALLPAFFWQFAGRELKQGRLHDRIVTLAWEGGVPFNSILIYPATKLRWISAFAMTGGRLGFTETLLSSLSRREVDAVAAHEMSHLRRRHRLKFFGALIMAQGILTFVYSLVDIQFPLPYDATEFLFTDLALMMIAAFWFLRRCEFAADADAAALTADPEALITALVKLTKLNGLPMHSPAWEESTSTHPSTDHRIRVLAERAGLPAERLANLLHQSDAGPDVYSLADAGAAFHDARVFSRTHKQRVQRRITFATLSVLILGPALMGCGIQLLGWQGWRQWAGFGEAWLATIVLLRLVENALPSFRWHERLQDQLQTKFRQQHWPITADDSSFASLSPGPALRKYDGVADWDLGYLCLRGDRLCFVGEEAKFALGRGDVQRVEIHPGPIGWVSTPWVVVQFHNSAKGSDDVFLLRPGTAATERQMTYAVHDLAERLTSWLERSPASETTESIWHSLPPPDFQSARADEPRLDDPLWDLLLVLSLVLSLAAGASALLGLTFLRDAGGTAWFVMGVTGGVVILEQLPSWLHRTPKPRSQTASAALRATPSTPSEAS